MSYRIKIDPRSRKAALFISQLQKKIQKALLASGKTQQEIADEIGVNRSVINRRLSGGANLTARSIAEFAYAFDKEIHIEFVDKAIIKQANSAISTDGVVRVQNEQRYHASGTIDKKATDYAKFNLEKIAS